MDARVKAYAKLNLTLAVTGVADGYHMLDSLVCSVDIFDYIKLKKRKDKLVTCEMYGCGLEGLPPEKNNAVRAAEEYIKAFDSNGVHIKIYKNIPVGAGLGGSSADAAGVLRGMSKIYGAGSEKQLLSLASKLGSDTAYQLCGGYARMFGKGDIIKKIDCRTQLNMLMLLPQGVSTAECFATYDKTGGNIRTSDGAESALILGNLELLGKELFNSLYPPAVKLQPQIGAAMEELKAFSPLGVGMTGSGSGVFALFESPEMCAWAKSRYRGKFACVQIKTV